MDYGVNGSEAEVNNIYRTFKRMGYYGPDPIKEFSEKEVCTHLDSTDFTSHAGEGPIMVYGENLKSHSGHVWILDGYCKSTTYSVNKEVIYNTFLFHCIWGWYGVNNGYFYLNNGKLGGSPQIPDRKDEGYTVKDYIYSNLKYIANFRINSNMSEVDLK